MVRHFDPRRRDIDHFPQASQADASQAQVTVWAKDEPMLHDLRRHGSLTRAVMLCLTLLARFFLFSLRLLRIGLDETRRRRLELLQFPDAFQCHLKLPLGLAELVSRLLKGCSQGLVLLP